MKYIIEATRTVFTSFGYQTFAILTFTMFFTLYAFILPATYTGGRIGMVSLQFITPTLALFAFLFALLLAFILPFAVYAFQKKRNSGSGNSSAVGSLFGSVIPPLLCCSPLLPTVAALFAGFFPFIFGVSGFIQGFIATYETPIFTIAALILLYSLWQNARQVVFAERGTCSS